MPDDNVVNMEKVAKKLANRIADLQYQVTQLEVLAETFRDQRDLARRDLKTALQSIQNVTSFPVQNDDVIPGETVEQPDE